MSDLTPLSPSKPAATAGSWAAGVAALEAAPAAVEATPAPAAGGYVSALDPLRGLAALAVALFHFTHNGWLPQDHWLARLGFFGHHGVETFLVISGFVVPYAMWRGAYTVGGFVPFLGRRLTRIFPPYIVSALILAVMNQMAPAGSAQRLGMGDLAGHLFLLNDLLGRPWLMAVYWTLALELQFYFLAGLAWPLLSSGRSWVFGLFASAAALAAWHWPGSPSILGAMAYFLLGLALFRQHARLDRPVVSAIFLIVIGAWISRAGPAALIAAALPVAAKFFIHRVSAPGRFLGQVSYSLYLFHLLAGASFLNCMAPFVSSNAARVALVPVALALSVGAAWLGYRLIEAPAIAWSRRFRYHGPDGGRA